MEQLQEAISKLASAPRSDESAGQNEAAMASVRHLSAEVARVLKRERNGGPRG
jgi:hypothetical protein